MRHCSRKNDTCGYHYHLKVIDSTLRVPDKKVVEQHEAIYGRYHRRLTRDEVKGAASAALEVVNQYASRYNGEVTRIGVGDYLMTTSQRMVNVCAVICTKNPCSIS